MSGAKTVRRVAFVLPWMGGGGIERLTLALMQGFLDQGHAVDLVLTEEGGNFMHLVPKAVHVELFECKRVRHTIPRLRDYIRRRRPDAMIVAVWPLTAAAVLARIGLKHRPRLILSDHNHLTTQYSHNAKAWAMLRTTLKWLYPRAEGLVGVSQGVAEDVARIAGLPVTRTTTIYNPIAPPERDSWPEAETDPLWQGHEGPRIISVGRFKKQKNHSLLLRAFAKIQKDSGAVLAMLGEGELEDDLKAEIDALGLRDHVLLPGFVVDPSPWYASATMFVLSSDYEGFGNVLVEAMHFGLSVVSTDCRSGPAEILANGQYGRLVPVGDADALAEAMQAMLAAPADPDAMKRRAADFSIENATRAYERLALAEPA
ncbi:MAG: glycosyltransferase [Blastomonas sp.]